MRMANCGNYVPTPKELDLLKVLLDPTNRTKTVKKICEMAGVNRQYYYQIFEKEDFVNYYNEKSLELVKASVGKVINATIKEAERGSHKHAVTILEMAGMIEGKHNNVTVNLNSELTPDERKAKIEKLKKLNFDG
jgi:hypothetical protein